MLVFGLKLRIGLLSTCDLLLLQLLNLVLQLLKGIFAFGLGPDKGLAMMLLKLSVFFNPVLQVLLVLC